MKSKKLITVASITGTLLSLGMIVANSGTVFAQTTNDTNTAKTNIEKHMPDFLKDLQRTVTNIENGIEITMTSTDSDTVSKLQSSKHPTPSKEDKLNITSTQTNLDNGVKITITSTDSKIVTKLQSKMQSPMDRGMHGPRGGFKHAKLAQNIEHKSENLTNGVKLTLTSTDAEAVAKLQSRETPPVPKDQNITVTKNNLTNGIEITMTSTDQETIKKLQNGPKMHRGFGKRSFEEKTVTSEE